MEGTRLQMFPVQGAGTSTFAGTSYGKVPLWPPQNSCASRTVPASYYVRRGLDHYVNGYVRHCPGCIVKKDRTHPKYTTKVSKSKRTRGSMEFHCSYQGLTKRTLRETHLLLGMLRERRLVGYPSPSLFGKGETSLVGVAAVEGQGVYRLIHSVPGFLGLVMHGVTTCGLLGVPPTQSPTPVSAGIRRGAASLERFS